MKKYLVTYSNFIKNEIIMKEITCEHLQYDSDHWCFINGDKAHPENAVILFIIKNVISIELISAE